MKVISLFLKIYKNGACVFEKYTAQQCLRASEISRIYSRFKESVPQTLTRNIV